MPGRTPKHALGRGLVHSPAPAARILLALLAALAAWCAFAAAGASAAPQPVPVACPVNADAVNPLVGSNFEAADGNMCAGTLAAGNADWANAGTLPLTDPTTLGQTDTVFGNGDPNTFIAGSAEQTPDSWQLTRGSLGAGKYDVMASWQKNELLPSGCTSITCKLFVYFAFTRQSATGSVDLGFELNQKLPGYRSSPATANAGSTPPTTVGEFGVPTRSEGDVLITFDQNGNKATIGMCLWHGDQHNGKWMLLDNTPNDLSNNTPADSNTNSSHQCTPLNTTQDTGGVLDSAQGAFNESAIASAGNSFPSPTGDLAALQFGEAGVDLLGAIRQGSGLTPCVSFGSAWMHSRSSEAITSNQEDWTTPQPVHIANCPTITIKKQTSPADTANPKASFGFGSDLPGVGTDTPPANGQFSLTDGGTKGPVTVPPGTYNVTELTQATGYSFDHLSCATTPGTSTASAGHADLANPAHALITVSGTDDVTCTYTNDKQGQLTIAKTTSPAGSGSDTFSFTPGSGFSSNTAFSLDTNSADSTNPDHKDFSFGGPNAFGNKVVSEDLAAANAAHWDLTGIACTDAQSNPVTAAFSSDGTSFHGSFTAGDKYVRADVEAGQHVTCTFHNDKRAEVTVQKSTSPSSSGSDSFGFTGTNLPGGSSFTLDTNGADNTNPDHSDFFVSDRSTATTIDESGQASHWDLTGLSCDGGTLKFGSGSTFTGTSRGASDSGVSITGLTAGQHVTCTFTNTQQAKVIVKKTTDPSNSGSNSFNFAGTNLPGGTSFTLDTNAADNTNPDQQTFFVSDRSTATTIGEDLAAAHGANWDLTGLSCDGGTTKFGSSGSQTNGSFQAGDSTLQLSGLAAGATVTCTFHNDKRAEVTVQKSTSPSSSGSDSFGFTGTNLPGGSSFALDTNGADNTNPDHSDFFVSDRSTATTIDESGQASHWDLTGLSCDGGTLKFGSGSTFTGTSRGASDSGVSITGLTAGQHVTCTFSNAKEAHITIDKATSPSSSGSSSFGFSTTGGGGLGSSFTLDTNGSDATNPSSVDYYVSGFGDKTITEAGTSGWDLTGLTCSNLTAGTATFGSSSSQAHASFQSGDTTVKVPVAAGDDVACHFTNTQEAKVTVVKSTAPADSGSDSFGFTGTNLPGGSSFSLDTHTAGHETKTFFVSDFSKPTLVDESGQASHWDLTGLSCSGATAHYGSGNDASTYTATSLGANTGARLDLSAGDVVTCTFTNAKEAHITIDKATSPSSSGSSSFGFSTTGGGGLGSSFTLDTNGSDATNPSSVDYYVSGFGDKTITEAGTSGWDLTGLTCSNLTAGTATFGSSSAQAHASFQSGDTTVKVPLAAGDDVACHFTNTRHAALVVAKVTDPASSADQFQFTTTDLSPSNPTLDTDSGTATPSSASWDLSAADLGTKVISENGKQGWDLTGIDCGTASVTFGTVTGNDNSTFQADGSTWSTGDNAVKVTVAAGDSVSCNFHNTQEGTVAIHKTAIGGSGTFDYTTSSAGATDITGVGSGTTSTQHFVKPGSYTYHETGQAGWDLTALSCDDSGQTNANDRSSIDLNAGTATFDVQPGENVVCTFTNTKHATVTVKKRTSPSGSSQSFGFTSPDLPGHSSFSLADGQDTGAIDVRAGAYHVSEGDPGAYRLTQIDCADPTSDSTSAGPTPAGLSSSQATINVAPGEAVVCTYTNTKTGPAIAIAKTGPATGTAGDLIPYTLTVTDPGDTSFPAAGVSVTDPVCTTPVALQAKNRGAGVDPTPDSLDPGDAWVYTCSVQTHGGDTRVDNVAHVSGTDTFGQTVTASDPFTTTLVQPQQQVLGQQFAPGTARIAGKSGCVPKAFKITVSGQSIDHVDFYVDGKRRASLHKADAKGRWVYKVDPRKYRPGSHLIVAKAFFTKDSQTKPKTLKVRFDRCVRRRAPAFTG